MASSRPFAYNPIPPNSLISGTTQLGDLAVGVLNEEYVTNYGGVRWWNGPDEDLGYVIAVPVSGNTQPTPNSGETASVGFYRSKFLTNPSFLEISDYLGNEEGQPPFPSTQDAYSWLTNQGYWTSFVPVTPTPTSTVVVTPTPSTTSTPTLTPTPTETETPTPTPTNTETPTNTPTPEPTTTPTNTPTNTLTPTPTNPSLLQILNETTGSRTVTSFTLDGTTQPLSSGSYPVTAGNSGYALTHGASSTPNGVVFNFGGSGTFDLYSYLNGSLVNYLSSYNNNSYTMGGLFLQTSDQVLLRITDSGALPTPTQTATQTTTPTPTPSVTNTQTPSVTPTNTQTPSITPTFTPTPSTSPVPVTGYTFNLIQLPYNFPSSGNTIMTQQGIGASGTTNPNLMTSSGNGIYFSNLDSIGVDRTSYFSQFTGQSITITFTQNGDSAIYSGNTNAFQSWSGGTGDPASPIPGKGFVFGTGIAQAGYSAGTATIIQSASTTWVTGATVYVSAVINGAGVTPTPTATSVTPTPTPTSGYTSDGWLFYSPNNSPVLGPPNSNGNTAFIDSATGFGTYNPNYTGGTFNLYFNNNTSNGTSYASQFSGLLTTGGTITINQGSSTAIYSGTSTDYQTASSYTWLIVTRSAQMTQSASTPFVSGTTINVVVS